MDLLTTAEAAQFMKFGEDARGINRFRVWACRHAVPRLHRGRTPLWERSVLIAFLNRKAWTLKRSAVA
jgi:hypothetical protein